MTAGHGVEWRLGVAVAMALATLATLAAGTVLSTHPSELGGVLEQYGLTVADVVVALVGVRIIAHSSRHTVGWLLLVISLAMAFSAFGGPYMEHELPAWLSHLTAAGWFVAAGGLVVLLMVMPTGRILSPAWRLPLLSLAGALVIVAAAGLTAPTIEPDGTPNPLSLPGVFVVAELLSRVVSPLLLAVGAGGGVASLVVRYRRSSGTQRRQLKWLVFGGALFAVAIVSNLPGLVGLGFAALPICCGIAIVRHGLFDIDRIISRTVAYALITGALIAVYAASVVTLRAVLTPIAAESDLAVAGSTLVVAALFGPVRRWVQAAVDRRFNRARYDAAQAVEAFGQRLRDEVDLDEVATALRSATVRTVEPAAVSVWLVPGKVTS